LIVFIIFFGELFFRTFVAGSGLAMGAVSVGAQLAPALGADGFLTHGLPLCSK
jgi:hypothetical protein